MRKLAVLISGLLIATAGCFDRANYFPQFTVLRVRSTDLDRDLAMFDQAAAQAGFSVTPNSVLDTLDGQRLVSLRIYKNSNHCCFRMSLSKWDQQAVMELIVSDSGAFDNKLQQSDCEMYERFRQTLTARLDRQRILFEMAPCKTNK